MEPLSIEWVERIHARLLARYMGQWLSLTKGIDEDALKADWAMELAGLSGEAIRHALDNLPIDRPPNVLQFKAVAINRPEPPKKWLPAPKADPVRVAEIIEGLQKLANPSDDPTERFAWAYALQEREKARDILTEGQRIMWREALTVVPFAQVAGEFKMIPDECLPPGMRARAST